MSERKKRTLQIAVGLLIFLLICTVVSQTVYRMLLPVVETVDAREGSLSSWVDADGRVGYTDQQDILAAESWRVTEVLVKQGAIVEAGTPLFQIDERQAQISLQQSELELLKLQNQLSASALNAAEQAELTLQIQIAEQELADYRNGLSLSSDIEELNLKLAVIQLENQQEVDEGRLQLAREQLASYQRKGAGMDTAAYERLDKQIASLSKRLLSASLSEEKRQEIEEELRLAREEQDALVSGFEAYDPLQEESLRQALREAEQKLKANGSERDRSVLELQKEIAQEQLALYQERKGDTAALQEKKLQLSILQLKNQLTGNQKSAAEKQELNRQIEIAQKQLELARANWPEGGVVLAPAAGTVTSIAARKGETLQAGKAAVTMTTEVSQPCVTWELSYEAGQKYADRGAAQVTLPRKGDILGKDETVEVNIAERLLDEETNRYRYTAPLPLEKAPAAGASVRVRLSVTGESYDHLIPLSCLRQDSYGNDTVLVLKRRQGIFSEEQYLAEIRVEVLDKNSMNAAVKSAEFEYDTKVVRYSSKPVSSGSVVSVGTV